jgi:tetratricopeptide (TPR) repeat protein
MQAVAEPSIDAESFLLALTVGRVDACLAYLKREDGNAAADAGLNCRLAEALLHQGRREEALECVGRALPWAGSDTVLLHICAWVFSNCGCHAEAASAYRHLIELCPEAIELHRHASGSLAAMGRLEEAVADGQKASNLAPQNPEFALHVGALLLAAGRYDEATLYRHWSPTTPARFANFPLLATRSAGARAQSRSHCVPSRWRPATTAWPSMRPRC